MAKLWGFTQQNKCFRITESFLNGWNMDCVSVGEGRRPKTVIIRYVFMIIWLYVERPARLWLYILRLFGTFVLRDWGPTATMYWHGGSLVRAVLGYRGSWGAGWPKIHKFISCNILAKPSLMVPSDRRGSVQLKTLILQVNLGPRGKGGGY